MDKNLFVFKIFLELSNYEVTKDMIRRYLSDYNNEVVSLTNTLDFFQIKNVVANVPKTALDQLPKNFIAQVRNSNTGNLVLVSKGSSGNIRLHIDGKTTITLSKEEFLANWTGLIIAIEKNEIKGNKKNFKQILNLSLILIILLLPVSYVILITDSFIKTTYFLLSVFGLIVSYFIVQEKLGHNTFMSKFCSQSQTTSCQNVLDSKGATLFNFFDLSDLAIAYFSFLILSYINEPNSVIFFYIASLSLVVVIYSVYQQFFVIKKWCPLCLGIGSVLILQFCITLLLFNELYFDYRAMILFTFFFGLVVFAVKQIMGLNNIDKMNHELIIENLSFRRNSDLFIPYYDTLVRIETEDELISQIQMGSKNPTIKITAVTSPICGACFDAHDTYLKLLEKYPEEIQINFRFFVSSSNRNDNGTLISERLLELYYTESNEIFNAAFDEWYSKISLEKWINKWGKCEDLKYNHILNTHNQWCSNNYINNTPTVLLNGRIFPKLYSVSDIENFIEELIKFEKELRNKEIHA